MQRKETDKQRKKKKSRKKMNEERTLGNITRSAREDSAECTHGALQGSVALWMALSDL